MLHKLIVQFKHIYVNGKVFLVIQQFVFMHQILMDIPICKENRLNLKIIKPIFCFYLFSAYNNGWRDANSLRAWAFQYLPSKVIELDEKNFTTKVLRDSKPWLIDFFGKIIFVNLLNHLYFILAPWCGHCHHFAPIFESIAQVSFVKFIEDPFK